MYLDIHALHTLPYSNVNRDGLNSPKGCVYGGTQRVRVSSQSWKRAARLAVEKQLGAPTFRTRQIAVEVRKQLSNRGWDEDDARRGGRAVVQAYGLTPEDDHEKDNTNVLLWIPDGVVQDLVTLAEAHRDALTAIPLPVLDDKGKAKKPSKADSDKRDKAIAAAVGPMSAPVKDILNRRSPTIALLGRMLADTPEHTVDGATQVAHAFTVHEASPDYDYFTAVDDIAPNSGAGHLATAEFSTGTFYRYCTINVTQLAGQLGDLDTALRIIDTWTRAFLTIVPSGKANSTAPATTAELAYLSVRDAPRSLAAAFERPVTLTDTPNGFAEPAQKRLADYTGNLHRFLGEPGHWSGHASITNDTHPTLGEHHPSLDDLIQTAGNTLLDRTQPAHA